MPEVKPTFILPASMTPYVLENSCISRNVWTLPMATQLIIARLVCTYVSTYMQVVLLLCILSLCSELMSHRCKVVAKVLELLAQLPLKETSSKVLSEVRTYLTTLYVVNYICTANHSLKLQAGLYYTSCFCCVHLSFERMQYYI